MLARVAVQPSREAVSIRPARGGHEGFACEGTGAAYDPTECLRGSGAYHFRVPRLDYKYSIAAVRVVLPSNEDDADLFASTQCGSSHLDECHRFWSIRKQNTE